MTTLVLDGHNLLFRAFSSVPRSITGANGEPINAVHGLLGAVIRLIREFEARHVATAFDDPTTPTFRHELYPPYQGQRGPMGGEHADNFARQVDIAAGLLPQLGIPAMSYPGYEADDIMGTLAHRLAARGQNVLIVSTDRDLLQLVRAGIGVITPASPPVQASNAEDVVARLGVGPSEVTTWKALAGDPSDNIPGVAGIGTKTATALVKQYGTLEEIYRHLDQLPPRVGASLKAGRSEAFLFRRIVTVVTDLDLSLDLGSFPQLELRAGDTAGDILRRAGLRD